MKCYRISKYAAVSGTHPTTTLTFAEKYVLRFNAALWQRNFPFIRSLALLASAILYPRFFKSTGLSVLRAPEIYCLIIDTSTTIRIIGNRHQSLINGSYMNRERIGSIVANNVLHPTCNFHSKTLTLEAYGQFLTTTLTPHRYISYNHNVNHNPPHKKTHTTYTHKALINKFPSVTQHHHLILRLLTSTKCSMVHVTVSYYLTPLLNNHPGSRVRVRVRVRVGCSYINRGVHSVRETENLTHPHTMYTSIDVFTCYSNPCTNLSLTLTLNLTLTLTLTLDCNIQNKLL